MSPRPTGSKNKSTIEKALNQPVGGISFKPGTNAITDDVNAALDATLHEAHHIAQGSVAAPKQEQNEILAAIQGLTQYVQNGFQKFDQRISDIEHRSDPVTGEPMSHTIPVMPSSNPVMSATIPDNDSPLPEHDPAMMRIVAKEADAMTKSFGLDKVVTSEVVSIGRAEQGTMQDVKCYVCGRPPVGRGAQPHDFIEVTGQNGAKQRVFCHNSCIPNVRGR